MSVGLTPTYHRKIKCPRNFILKPGGVPFVMIRNPALKNIKEADAKRFGVNLWLKKRDPRTGQPIYNVKDYIQPETSAAELREQLFEPSHPICAKCKRCVCA